MAKIKIQGVGTFNMPEGMSKEEAAELFTRQFKPTQAQKIEDSNLPESDKQWLRENNYDLAGLRSKITGELPQEQTKAVLETEKEERPIPSAFFPRLKEERVNDGEGVLDGTGSAALDAFSLIPRMVQGGASAIGGGDFLEETAKTGATPDQSGFEAFGEDFARDPTLMIPFGTLAKPLKAGYQAAKGTKLGGAISKALTKAPVEEVVEETASQALRNIEKAKVKEAHKFLKGSNRSPEAVSQFHRNVDNILTDTRPEIMKAIAKESKEARSLKRYIPKAKTVGKETAKEVGITAGLQVAEDGEISPEGLALSSVMAGAGQGLGEGLQHLSKSALASKMKFIPRMQSRRYASDSDVILDEGLMPWTGGANKIHQNLKGRLDDINVIRAEEMSKATKGAVPTLNIDNPEAMRQQLKDAEKSMINYDDVFDEAQLNIDMSMRDSDFRNRKASADEFMKSEKDWAGLQQGGKPFIRDIAQQQGVYSPDLNEIIMGVNPSLGPVKPLADMSSGWFTGGKVNRQTFNQNPTEGMAVGSEALYDASRKPINEFLGKSSPEYAKILPLEEAVNQALPRIGNKGWTEYDIGRPLRGPFTSNPFIKGSWQLGDAMRSDSKEFLQNLKRDARMNISEYANEEEEGGY